MPFCDLGTLCGVGGKGSGLGVLEKRKTASPDSRKAMSPT